VFLREVLGEGFFSSAAISFAAACANLSLSVEDDPDRLSAFALSEVEAGGFSGDASNISAMAASVTKILPATRATRKRPLRISVLSEAIVSGPFGKKALDGLLEGVAGLKIDNGHVPAPGLAVYNF
jgi:hypothetical protein